MKLPLLSFDLKTWKASLVGQAAWLAGGLVSAVGWLVLAGWFFNVPALKSVLPTFVSMKANTALCFALLGLALVCLRPPVSPRRKSVGQLLALMVMLIGGVTACEYALGWNLGLDECLFRDDPNPVVTVFPGRMALSSALCFILLSLALLRLDWEPRRGFRPAEVTALVVGGSGLISVMEYGLGFPVLFAFSHYTCMAVHTAAGFMVLAAGILLACPAQGWVGAVRAGWITHRQVWAYGFLVLIGLVLLAAGGWFYHSQEEQLEGNAERELDAVANLKVREIVNWRRERLADARLVRGTPYAARRALDVLAQPETRTTRIMFTGWLDSLMDGGPYERAVLLDAERKVRLVHPGNASHELCQGVYRDAEMALRTREIVVTDLHRTEHSNRIHLSFLVPLVVRREGAADNVPAAGLPPAPADRSTAVLVLEVNIRDNLFPLLQSWPTASRTAETLLVRRDGDSVLFLNELRHRTNMALALRIPLTHTNVPAVMAVLGKQGVVVGRDYRGVEVLSVLKTIPNSPWFMVTKMDTAEAFAAWNFRSVMIQVTVLGFILMLSVTALLLWQRGEKAHYRALYQAERQQQVLKARFELLIKHANDIIVLTDGEGRILEVNDRAVESYGHTREALIDQPVRTLVATEQHEDYAARMQTVMREGHFRGETVHQRKDGSRFPVEVSIRHFEVDGTTFVQCITRDITEHKQAEVALRTSEERLNFALKMSHIGAWELNLVDHTAYRTLIHDHIFGYATLLPRWTYEMFVEHVLPEDRPEVERRFHKAIAELTDWHFECRIRRVDGEVRWIWAVGGHELNKEGSPTRMSGIVQDITERKQLEQDRLAMETQLRQQQKLESIGTLAAGVAHEINNPINGVMNYAQLILDKAEPGSRSAEFAAEIIHESERVANIVRSLLQFSRQEKQEYSPRHIPDLIEQTLTLVRTVIRHDQIDLRVEVPPDLPAIKCRSQQIQQVLLNLLTNARDASNAKYPKYDADKIIILSAQLIAEGGVRKAELASPNSEICIRITVEDHGTGIPVEIQGRIFDPFFTTKSRSEGTGLGLAISHGIVKEHQGKLWLESELGKGTKFHVDLPVN
ncbi:MAG: PAS domain S-box protein [Verrucomicrobiota bacterium]